MTKLFSRASVSGASLSGANLKTALTILYDALSSVGITDASRTTISASTTLLTTQCGIVLVDCGSGNVVLTLPTSGSSTDEAEYKIRRIDSAYANTLTVQRGGTDSIEGSTTTPVTISCGGEAEFKLPGGTTNWRITDRGGATQQAAREALNVPSINYVDNPDGEIYQRTAAATADDTYSEDRWYELTQTGTVTPSQQATPEDGFAYAARITQSQASAQRFGRAQILEGKRSKKLRGKTVTFGGRVKLSAGANLRMAILAWTGTEDAVTSDVVNDWTSGAYTAGNFFVAANFTVVAVSPSIACTAATARDASVTGTIPSGANNIVVVYWTEATAAQNVTLDAWGRRLIEGATLGDYIRRSEGEELRRCRRFYRRQSTSARFYVATATALTGFPVMYDEPMRAVPTVNQITAPSTLNVTSSTWAQITDHSASFEVTGTSVGACTVAGRVDEFVADL